jgi:hypothetical protein
MVLIINNFFMDYSPVFEFKTIIYGALNFESDLIHNKIF